MATTKLAETERLIRVKDVVPVLQQISADMVALRQRVAALEARRWWQVWR